MEATITDPVQGWTAQVKSTGEVKVEATPATASSVTWNQTDIVATVGGTQIVASLTTRRAFMITNLDPAKIVYLGFGSAPTITTGFPIMPLTTLNLPASVTTFAEIIGITSAGTARIAFAEFT